MINSDDKELKAFLKQGLLSISHQHLEENVMRKVEFIAKRNISVKRNLKKSWIFLVCSVVMFPLAYWYIFHQVDKGLENFNSSFKELVDVMFPAGILVFSVIILLMIDNLIKLSSKKHIGY